MIRRLSLQTSRRLAQSQTFQPSTPFRRALAVPTRIEPVRVRLPEDDSPGLKLRSINKWFKKEGDKVKSGEPLCEVDAGDVVYDFNSPVSGFVVRITAKEGSMDLKGGEVIAYMAGSQDQITSVSYEAAKEIAEHKVTEHAPEDYEESKSSSNDELTTWLQEAGGQDLLEYAEAFKNEGFTTVAALKELEEADFDAMKITKRGHRKTLLAAAQKLKAASQ